MTTITSMRALSLACVCCGLSGSILAQDMPGRPLILDAAAQLNAVAPQAMPQQTIRIGHFDGATNQFSFALSPSYPPNTPNYKKAENGGPVQPRYVADIRSYNVRYEFTIANKPADFRLTVQVPRPNGSMAEMPATINGAGTRATIDFHPHVSLAQLVKIQRPGTDTAVRVTPHLAEQLGAFVTPYLLVGIVYEPPGAQSSASYSQTNTSNTVTSWGFARTSGMVETVDPEAMMNLFIQGTSTAVDKLYPGAGQAISIIAGLREQSTVTTTTTQTVGSTGSAGTSLSITAGFDTDLHRYPGEGDRFLVLHDVLFVYAVRQGKVVLTPMAYSGVLGLTAAEMRQRLPAAVVQQFLAMNPHFNPGLLRSTPLLARASLTGIGTRGTRFEKFDRYATVACQASGGNTLAFSEADFQSNGRSVTTSQTSVEKVTGLAASISGGGDDMWGITYSSSTEQGTSAEQTTSIRLQCDPATQFWVHVYFDNLFRSFLTVRGAPFGVDTAIAGAVADSRGRPQSGRPVALDIGGQRFIVFSDRSGAFAFPSAGLPKGSGVVSAGALRSPVAYQGTPIKGLRLSVSSDSTAAPVPAAPVRPKAPIRTPITRPRPTPGLP